MLQVLFYPVNVKREQNFHKTTMPYKNIEDYNAHIQKLKSMTLMM